MVPFSHRSWIWFAARRHAGDFPGSRLAGRLALIAAFAAIGGVVIPLGILAFAGVEILLQQG